MSNDIKLDSLKKVDVRTIWEREDKNFTPWLAQEENIALLGDTIGFELEVQEEEAAVGPFRADILCRDTVSTELVIIENQLEKTDHTHLGQTLTYAAGLDAVTIIWVALRFVEEHRAALDWLNRITHENIRFFGIEIEAWRIGNSLPAAKFNVVAKPNDWSKTVKDTVSNNSVERQKKWIEFWTNFLSFLKTMSSGNYTSERVPGKHNQMEWSLVQGTKVRISVKRDAVTVKLVLYSNVHSTWFNKLRDKKGKIESDLDFKLEWDERIEQKESHISISTLLDDAQTNSEETFSLLLEHMEAMYRVFRPRIADLDDEPMPEELDE